MSFVQAASNTNFSTTSNTLTATLSGGASNPDQIDGIIGWDGSSAISSIMTDKGDVGTPLMFLLTPQSGFTAQAFVVPNVTAGATALIVVWAAPVDSMVIDMGERSGTATSSPEDVQEGRSTNGFPAGTNSIASSASGTTTNFADQVVAYLLQDGDASTTTLSAGTSPQAFTKRDEVDLAGPYPLTAILDYQQSAPAAARATFTPDATIATSEFAVIMVAYKPAGAGGTPYNPWPQAAPLLAQ